MMTLPKSVPKNSPMAPNKKASVEVIFGKRSKKKRLGENSTPNRSLTIDMTLFTSFTRNQLQREKNETQAEPTVFIF